MPTFFVNTDDARISNAFLATLGAAPGSTYLAQIKAFGLVNSVNAMIAATGKTTAADLATTITGNLGLTGAAATAGQAYLTSVTLAGASSTWGANLISTLDLFTTLQNDATYGTAASAYVARINSAVAYSAVAGNNSTDLTTLAAAVGSAGSTGAGSTFTLTTNADVLPGSSGNDTFTGSVAGTVTLSAGDSISGGAGTDELRVAGAGASATTLSGVSLSSIEVLNLLNPGDNTQDLSILAGSGITTLKMNAASVNGKTVTGIAGLSTVSLNTAGNAVMAGTLTVALNSGVTAPTFNLEGFQGVTGGTPVALTVTGSGATSMTVNSTTLANGVSTFTLPATVKTVNLNSATNLTVATSLVAAAATAVNISGAGNSTLTLTDLANSNVVVDASSASGKVTYGIEAGATGVTFKGGSGNDKVVVLAGDLASASANAAGLSGNGGTDTLQINDTTPVYAQINKVSGFEVLELGTTGATVDVAQVTAMSSFAVAAGNLTETFNNSKSTTAYTIDNSAGNSGTITINNAVGEQSANVTIDYGTATAAKTLAKITLTGAANVGIVSTGTGSGGSNVLTALENLDNSTITITGTKGLTITNALAATATGSKVDANAFTGKLSVVGSTKADVIIGGTDDDVIAVMATGTTAAAADQVTTGTGNDTVVLRGTVASGVVSTIKSTASYITDFRVGGSATTTDILALTATKGDYAGAATNFNGTVAAAAAGSTVVMSVAQNASAAAITAGTDLIKLTTAVSTTSGTTTLQSAFNTAIGTATITGIGNASEEIYFALYDNTEGRMFVGIVDAGAADQTIGTGDTVTLIGSIAMSSTDFASFGANHLQIVA